MSNVEYINEQSEQEESYEIQPIMARFTDTAEEEIKNLLSEMKIMQVVSAITAGQELPEDLRMYVLGMVGLVADIFSVDLPCIDKDPNVTLQLVSREINLSRLLRERGLFRLYRLLRVQEDAASPARSRASREASTRCWSPTSRSARRFRSSCPSPWC